jgi:hypothetical protein
MIDNMERGVANSKYFATAAIFVFVPLVQVLMAGIALVIFNAILGGEATFKQVFAIVVHSGVIGVLQTLFVMPLNYVRETMSSATSFAVFLPMVDDMSFLGRVAGAIDIFRIWSIISVAIGLGILYKRRTAPIAWALLIFYFVVALAIAGIQYARSGV